MLCAKAGMLMGARIHAIVSLTTGRATMIGIIQGKNVATPIRAHLKNERRSSSSQSRRSGSDRRLPQ